MTLKEAVSNHDIDVAGLEISDPLEKLGNLRKWLDQVDDAAERQAGYVLFDLASKVARKEKLTRSESDEAIRICEEFY